MNKIIRLAIANLLLMPVILFAAEPQAELKNLEGVINIADTIGNENIAKRAALAVGIANPKLKITILKMSVPDAVAAVGSGKADLILLDQRLPQKLRGKIDYKLYRYAANPAVIAVNVKNTLNSITSQQLRDIFSGNIESWLPFTNAGYMIHRFGIKPEMPGAQPFNDKIMLQQRMTDKIYTLSSNEELQVVVCENEYSIGFCGFIPELNENMKLLNVDGVEPSIKNIRDGKYKPVIYYYVCVAEKSGKPARIFAGLLRKPELDSVIIEAGLLPAAN